MNTQLLLYTLLALIALDAATTLYALRIGAQELNDWMRRLMGEYGPFIGLAVTHLGMSAWALYWWPKLTANPYGSWGDIAISHGALLAILMFVVFRVLELRVRIAIAAAYIAIAAGVAAFVGVSMVATQLQVMLPVVFGAVVANNFVQIWRQRQGS